MDAKRKNESHYRVRTVDKRCDDFFPIHLYNSQLRYSILQQVFIISFCSFLPRPTTVSFQGLFWPKTVQKAFICVNWREASTWRHFRQRKNGDNVQGERRERYDSQHLIIAKLVIFATDMLWKSCLKFHFPRAKRNGVDWSGAGRAMRVSGASR